MEHKADCRNELYSWFNIQFSFYYIFYHLIVKHVQFPRKSKDTVQDPQAPRSLVQDLSLKDKDRPQGQEGIVFFFLSTWNDKLSGHSKTLCLSAAFGMTQTQ